MQNLSLTGLYLTVLLVTLDLIPLDKMVVAIVASGMIVVVKLAWERLDVI
jgi:hypothetical protein